MNVGAASDVVVGRDGYLSALDTHLTTHALAIQPDFANFVRVGTDNTFKHLGGLPYTSKIAKLILGEMKVGAITIGEASSPDG